MIGPAEFVRLHVTADAQLPVPKKPPMPLNSLVHFQYLHARQRPLCCYSRSRLCLAARHQTRSDYVDTPDHSLAQIRSSPDLARTPELDPLPDTAILAALTVGEVAMALCGILVVAVAADHWDRPDNCVRPGNKTPRAVVVEAVPWEAGTRN